MNLIKKLFKPIAIESWWQDLALSIPRIVCGYLLAFHFGSDKFGMPWSPEDKNLGLFEIAFWFPNDVATYGGIFEKFSVFFAWMAGFSEAVGGLLLVLGLQTRLSAFLILVTMLVAIFMQQIQNGMWNTLPALGFLWVALYCVVIGSGRFGLDYLISKKWRNEKK